LHIDGTLGERKIGQIVNAWDGKAGRGKLKKLGSETKRFLSHVHEKRQKGQEKQKNRERNAKSRRGFLGLETRGWGFRACYDRFRGGSPKKSYAPLRKGGGGGGGGGLAIRQPVVAGGKGKPPSFGTG